MNGNNQRNGDRLTQSQLSYVNGIARDFNCGTMDELARKLGYGDANAMAGAEQCENIYDYWTKGNFPVKYLRVKGLLDR